MHKIGVIGFGYWGPNIALNIQKNDKLVLKVVCDQRKERVEKAEEIFLNRTSYQLDADQVISDPQIDAVAIAVEANGHYSLVKKALEVGKHVFVEKPLATSAKQAEEILNLASKKNLIVHVDHIMLYHPVVRRLKELVDSGQLGKLIYIDASRMNLGQIRMDVNAMWDLAVHDLSVIDYLTDGQKPAQITAIGEKRYSRLETLTFLTIEYDEFIAHTKSSWISPMKERKMIVAGMKKMAVFDDMELDNKLMLYDKGVDVIEGEKPEYEDYAVKVRHGDILIPMIPQEDALYNSINHFAQCIQTGSESISGPGQAIRILKILEEADAQMRKKS